MSVQRGGRRHWRETMMVAGIALFGVWAFLTLARRVSGDGPVVTLDRAIYDALQGLRSPVLDRILITITEFGDTFVVTGLTIGVVLWLLWRRTPRTALFFAAGVGLASLANSLVKLTIARPRPLNLDYTGVSLFSFPSGHATVNAVLYALLALLVARQYPVWRRIVAYTLAGVWVGLIGFSRIYLGAHWFSDVLASSAFAASFVALGYDFYRHRVFETYEGWRLGRAALVILAGLGALHVALNFSSDGRRYAPGQPIPIVESDAGVVNPAGQRTGRAWVVADQSAVSAPPLSL